LKVFVALFFISHVIANVIGNNNANEIIDKTESKYRLVNDYEVRMMISMKIPAFRMPKKDILFFLNNQIK
jgi:hypothetical protein